MKRLKTPLRSAMSDARLSLSVIYIHKHKEIDLNEVISVFAGRKVNRYIPFAFRKVQVSLVILIYSASVFFLLLSM